jgi:hypothetical protein
MVPSGSCTSSTPTTHSRVGRPRHTTIRRLPVPLLVPVAVLLLDTVSRFGYVESLLTTSPTTTKSTSMTMTIMPRSGSHGDPFRIKTNVAVPATRGILRTRTAFTTRYSGRSSDEDEENIFKQDEREGSYVTMNSNNSSPDSSRNKVSEASSSSTTILPSTTMTTTTTTNTVTSPQFGDVMPLKRPTGTQQHLVDSTGGERNALDGASFQTSSASSIASTTTDPVTMAAKRRNTQVAIFSVALACLQYLWQYLHPLEPISLLVQMQQQSSPVTVIGTTEKPTVVDFWAPWYVDSSVCQYLFLACWGGCDITHTHTDFFASCSINNHPSPTLFLS